MLFLTNRKGMAGLTLQVPSYHQCLQKPLFPAEKQVIALQFSNSFTCKNFQGATAVLSGVCAHFKCKVLHVFKAVQAL